MNKKNTLIICAIILVLSASLIKVGHSLARPESQKREGLSEVYDITADGQIAAGIYNEGKPSVYLFDQNMENSKKIGEGNLTQELSFLQFSPDNTKLLCIFSTKQIQGQDDRTDKEKKAIESSILEYDLNSGKMKTLFNKKGIIQRAYFTKDNKQIIWRFLSDQNSLLFPAQRSDDHIYAYHIELNKQTPLQLELPKGPYENPQYTLELINKDSLYLSISEGYTDDWTKKKPEDSLLKYSLSNLHNYEYIQIPDHSVGSLAISQKGNNFSYVTSSNPDQYEPELCLWNLEKKEKTILSNTIKAPSNLRFSEDAKLIYYMEDSINRYNKHKYTLFRYDIHMNISEKVNK
ncbi:hypothetical protein [Bacillus sp. 1P06AnD]|uniref:hypothetical protein n=1 Tax=Bacillus sp. 1P06AnD TaxID=3132208 RepID=UPI0039A3CD03